MNTIRTPVLTSFNFLTALMTCNTVKAEQETSDICSMELERSICPIAELALWIVECNGYTVERFAGYDIDLTDVVHHVTIRPAVAGWFPISGQPTMYLARFQDIKPQTNGVMTLTIWGHVTIVLNIWFPVTNITSLLRYYA